VAAVLGDEAFDLLSQRGDVARNLFQRIALTFQLEKERVLLAIRVTTWSPCCASTPVALLALVSRVRSCASRAF